MKKVGIVLGFIFAVALSTFISMGCKDKDADKVYTVRYAYDNEYVIEVRLDDVYEIPEIPVKDGYVFDGLYDSEVDGTKYVNADGRSVRPFLDAKDIVLFVRFVAREYKFEFCYDEGTLSSDGAISAESGKELGALPILNVGVHRVFNGWRTASNGGDLIADGDGRATQNYKVFDHSNYEQGDGYKVKLYADVGYEKLNVKFFNGTGDDKTLIEELTVEYGTDIADAALGLKIGDLDVISWTADGESVASGAITSDGEYSALLLGRAVDLRSASGTIVLSGQNANALLYGDPETSYENINISIGGGSDSAAHIILKNANIIGDSPWGTVTSTSDRTIIIETIGTNNYIGTSENGAPAINLVNNTLEIMCRAPLRVRGGDGKSGVENGGRGGDGIIAASLSVFAGENMLEVIGGNGGNAYNRAIGDNGGDGSNGRNGFRGGDGGDGVRVTDDIVIFIGESLGEVRIAGGNGGSGGDASECNRREFTKGEKHVVGGRGGNGGDGGIAVNAAVLTYSSGSLTLVGGNGGKTGKAGGVHDNDTSGWNASVLGNTTASRGAYGTPGSGGKALCDEIKITCDISAASRTNGKNGELITEINWC